LAVSRKGMISWLGQRTFELGKTEGFAEGGDGDLVIRFRFGAAYASGGECGFGVDELGSQRESLFESSAGEGGAFGGLIDGLEGDGEAFGAFHEIQAGLFDLQIEGQEQASFEFLCGAEMGAGFADLAAGAVPVPEIPLGLQPQGVTVARPIEFPPMVVVVTAEGLDLWQSPAAGTANLGFGGVGLATGGEEFGALGGDLLGRELEGRHRCRDFDGWRIEAEKIAECAQGQCVGIARSREILAGLGQADFDVQHLVFEGGAGIEAVTGDAQIGFKGLDRRLGGLDELAGFLHGKEGARNLEGQRVADCVGLVAGRLGLSLGGSLIGGNATARVEGQCDEAVDVQVIGIGNVVEVERGAERLLVDGGAENLDGIVRADIARAELNLGPEGGAGLVESGAGGGDAMFGDPRVGAAFERERDGPFEGPWFGGGDSTSAAPRSATLRSAMGLGPWKGKFFMKAERS
jgi:hypothetical protein